MFIFGSTCIYFLAHLVLELVTCYLNLHQIFLEMRNGKKNLLKVISEYHMHLCKLPNWIVWTENMTFEILQNAMDKVKILIESCWVVNFGSKVIFKLTSTLTWRILPISIGNRVIFKINLHSVPLLLLFHIILVKIQQTFLLANVRKYYNYYSHKPLNSLTKNWNDLRE